MTTQAHCALNPCSARTRMPSFAFDNTYARELPGLYTAWKPAGAPAPRLLYLNTAQALSLIHI